MRAQEFVQETTGEMQQVNVLAGRTVAALMEILKTNKPAKLGYSWRDLVVGPRLQLQMYAGIPLKNLNIPRSSDPVINKLINSVSIRIDFEKVVGDQLNTASYVHGDSRTIVIRPNAAQVLADHQGISIEDAMHNDIAHEMQHAVDDIKSGGVALNDPNPKNAANVKSTSDYEQYLKLPYEINARFAQSAAQIARGIANGQINSANLANSIKLTMDHNDLVDIFKDKPKAYQKLAKRLYLFFQAELASPKKVEPGTLFAKVKSWLTGRPHEVIKEDDNLENLFNSYELYRGMSIPEAKKVLQLGHLLPSTDLMPLDWEVVEYGLGDYASQMSEEEVDQWVQDVCPWYNGTHQSIQGGVNLTTDWDNARGYAGNGVVMGVICRGDVAEFSDAHYFAQSAAECVPAPVAMLDSLEITLDELKKKLGL